MLVIVDGKRASLAAILRGDVDGTVFKPTGDRMDHRKRWIAHAIKEMGTLEVDAGAARALTEQGREPATGRHRRLRGQLHRRRPGRGRPPRPAGSPRG